MEFMEFMDLFGFEELIVFFFAAMFINVPRPSSMMTYRERTKQGKSHSFSSPRPEPSIYRTQFLHFLAPAQAGKNRPQIHWLILVLGTEDDGHYTHYTWDVYFLTFELIAAPGTGTWKISVATRMPAEPRKDTRRHKGVVPLVSGA